MAAGSIAHVSETARWVAYYRAMETARPDAIFRDPYAERLAGERGKAIVDTLPRARQAAWAMIVRTALFDEIILGLVLARQVDLVVNLAAGLDTRPWRLALPAELRWVDVDLPEMLRHKADILAGEPTACRYEAVAADLRDEASRTPLFDGLSGSSRASLIVSEGLLIYLTPLEVGSLARDLHAAASFRWWLTDLANPTLLAMVKRSWGPSLTNAPFQFAPEEGTDFFAPFGWSAVEFRATVVEAQRLHREMPMMWLWRLVAHLFSVRRQEALRRMSATILLERD